MYLDLTPEQQAFRDELRDYFSKLVTPELLEEMRGSEGGSPGYHKALQQMGADGLLGLGWPKEYGGQARGPVDHYIFTDEVQRRADEITDRLSRGSTLFRNEGDGTFTDISDAAGVRDGQWGWGAEFLDYNNDGRLDLYAVNGFISGPIPDDL